MCGLIFHHAAVDASVVPLADLEPTRASDLSVLDVTIEATPGLEPTRFQGTEEVAQPPIAELEATAVGAVQVVAELIPGLEPTRVTEEDLPSALLSELRCRYCGTTGQAQGLFCDRCGMRLPRLPGDAVEGRVSVEEAPTCRSCGSQRFAGGMCVRCGARAPSSG